MDQKKRILGAVIALILIISVVLGVDYLQRRKVASQTPEDMPPGSIPIIMDGKFVASFIPEDLDQLDDANFVDAEEGKIQEGWLLKDVLLLHVDEGNLEVETQIVVSSSSRKKSKTLTWSDVENPKNIVMFDLASRGTVKLVSNIPGFDIREAWIQDVDKIEVVSQ